MAKKSTLNIVSLKEALNNEITVNQALIELLVEKGLITNAELMMKIEEVSKDIGENNVDN